MTQNLKIIFFSLGVSFLLGACNHSDSSSSIQASGSPGIDESLKNICSDLEFPRIQWPDDLMLFEAEAFQLALNITGSFEGHEGWKNLANNFDGQGMSLGLLNQPLGVGSLQPLLIQLRDRHRQTFRSFFKTSHWKSVEGMLSRWSSARAVEIHANPEPLSPWDNDYPEDIYQALSANAESVRWAVNNLYDSRNQFRSSWKREFQNLAVSPEYIQIQVESAWKLHELALQLQKSLGVYELRSYLLMFDVVVQNGNLKPQDHIDYAEWINLNPQANSTQRLEKITELRLRHVKPRWVKVVRDRKMSIIHGVGKVHGQNRAYESEYCFDRLLAFGAPGFLP